MAATQIICPKCKNLLNKPPQLQMMGDIKGAGGGFIAFGDPDDTLTCPMCGCRIRIGDIIDGKHDPGAGGWVSAIVGLAVVGACIWLVAKCVG